MRRRREGARRDSWQGREIDRKGREQQEAQREERSELVSKKCRDKGEGGRTWVCRRQGVRCVAGG